MICVFPFPLAFHSTLVVVYHHSSLGALSCDR